MLSCLLNVFLIKIFFQKKHRVEPILYMTEWFMCVFSRTLPWSCVLRVWDMFFCEGNYIMVNRKFKNNIPIIHSLV